MTGSVPLPDTACASLPAPGFLRSPRRSVRRFPSPAPARVPSHTSEIPPVLPSLTLLQIRRRRSAPGKSLPYPSKASYTEEVSGLPLSLRRLIHVPSSFPQRQTDVLPQVRRHRSFLSVRYPEPQSHCAVRMPYQAAYKEPAPAPRRNNAPHRQTPI